MLTNADRCSQVGHADRAVLSKYAAGFAWRLQEKASRKRRKANEVAGSSSDDAAVGRISPPRYSRGTHGERTGYSGSDTHGHSQLLTGYSRETYGVLNGECTHWVLLATHRVTTG